MRLLLRSGERFFRTMMPGRQNFQTPLLNSKIDLNVCRAQLIQESARLV